MNEKTTRLPKIQPGYRIGKIEVLKSTDDRKNGYTVWQCKCVCGNELFLDTRALQRGTITDCGCYTKVRPGQKDLTGQRFGKLVCLAPTDKRGSSGGTVWQCKCDCGTSCMAVSTQLTNGYKRSCGCLSKPPRKDWVGKRFGKLTVLAYDSKNNGSHFWQCKCDCGREAVVSQSNLKNGHTTSCGCIANPANTRHFVDGTCLEQIRSKKVCSVNTSGVRGVYQIKRNAKWAAQITFKGKTQYLGAYATLEEAARARRKAEERYFGECLEQYADLVNETKKIP